MALNRSCSAFRQTLHSSGQLDISFTIPSLRERGCPHSPACAFLLLPFLDDSLDSSKPLLFASCQSRALGFLSFLTILILAQSRHLEDAVAYTAEGRHLQDEEINWKFLQMWFTENQKLKVSARCCKRKQRASSGNLRDRKVQQPHQNLYSLLSSTDASQPWLAHYSVRSNDYVVMTMISRKA